MGASFKTAEGALIAVLTGEVDHHKSGALRQEIDGAMAEAGCRHLILDLEKVTFMDSSGIGVVLGRYNKVKDLGGRMYVTGCLGYVERILYMAGVFTLVEKRDRIEDAVEEERKVSGDGK